MARRGRDISERREPEFKNGLFTAGGSPLVFHQEVTDILGALLCGQ
jgi:hypothetical protein